MLHHRVGSVSHGHLAARYTHQFLPQPKFVQHLLSFVGFIIDFISGPVSIGFTSAAAIIIATTQVKDVLGLSYPGGKFLEVWEQIFEHINETRLWDCILGFSCMAVLLSLRVGIV